MLCEASDQNQDPNLVMTSAAKKRRGSDASTSSVAKRKRRQAANDDAIEVLVEEPVPGPSSDSVQVVDQSDSASNVSDDSLALVCRESGRLKPHILSDPKKREQLLKLGTMENKSLVVGLSEQRDILKRVEAMGLTISQKIPLTLDSLGEQSRREYLRIQRIRKQKQEKSGRSADEDDGESDVSDVSSYQDCTPEGEWEVKSIRDVGIDDDGGIKYLVHWKGWEGSDTWEPAAYLANAMCKVKEFLDNRDKKYNEDITRRAAELKVLVEKLMSNDGDVAVLYKLFNKKPNFQNKQLNKQIDELRKTLGVKTRMLRDLKDSSTAGLTVEHVYELVTKELGLEDPDKTLAELRDLADARVKGQKRLMKRKEKLQQRIKEQGDNYIITMENLFDGSVPANFEYFREYQYFDVDIPEEPVIYCKSSTSETGKKKKRNNGWTPAKKTACTAKGCMLATGGRCPCTKESGKTPYDKDGTLLLGAREPIYECNSKCVCSKSCRFSVVPRGCKYKLCIFNTGDRRGWGLRTLERIPKGKFITTYNGEVVSAKEKNQRDKTEQEWKTTYMFDLDYNPEEQDDEILAVDARFKGNLARFINHSCLPNLQINPCWNENQDRRMPLIAFFTTRAINEGEELTIDYDARSSELNEEFGGVIDQDERSDPHNFTRFCCCGAPKCRGYIM